MFDGIEIDPAWLAAWEEERAASERALLSGPVTALYGAERAR